MIVLDTHTWVWWTAKRHKLSPVAIAALENTDRLAIASITLWEIAMLVEKKRIALERNVLDWLQKRSMTQTQKYCRSHRKSQSQQRHS